MSFVGGDGNVITLIPFRQEREGGGGLVFKWSLTFQNWKDERPSTILKTNMAYQTSGFIIVKHDLSFEVASFTIPGVHKFA